MKTENESCALVMAMKCSNLAARIVLSAMECMDPMGDTGSSPPIPPQELLQLWDSPSSIEDGKSLPVPPPEIESHAERMPVTPPELLNGDYTLISPHRQQIISHSHRHWFRPHGAWMRFPSRRLRWMAFGVRASQYRGQRHPLES